MEFLRFEYLPSGQNAIVAIATHTGYNQEDSLIINQSSVDRGLFRSTFYRSYRTIEDRSIHVDERFEIPNKNNCEIKMIAVYDKLDQDGLACPGERVRGDDVLVGKSSAVRQLGEEMLVDTPTIAGNTSANRVSRRDCSTMQRSSETGVVDAVSLTTNADGNRFVKVRVRSVRVPQIGDKFSSRHGQKGTCGMLYRFEIMNCCFRKLFSGRKICRIQLRASLQTS
jgi:DNA-directed RNA polymerase II subunit RPB2